MKSVSIKTKMIIFLTGFAVFLSVKDKDPVFLLMTAIALASAIITDFSFAFYCSLEIFAGLKIFRRELQLSEMLY